MRARRRPAAPAARWRATLRAGPPAGGTASGRRARSPRRRHAARRRQPGQSAPGGPASLAGVPLRGRTVAADLTLRRQPVVEIAAVAAAAGEVELVRTDRDAVVGVVAGIDNVARVVRETIGCFE